MRIDRVAIAVASMKAAPAGLTRLPSSNMRAEPISAPACHSASAARGPSVTGT